jgi:hypothetical protein
MEFVRGEKFMKKGEPTMSIEKKSLISNLKTAKKANVIKESLRPTTTASVKSPAKLLSTKSNTKMLARVTSAKALSKKS